jgi:hypothetical protein
MGRGRSITVGWHVETPRRMPTKGNIGRGDREQQRTRNKATRSRIGKHDARLS